MPNPKALIQRATDIIDQVRKQRVSAEQLARTAAALSEVVLDLAEIEKSDEYRERAEVLSRMMIDRRGRVFTTTLTDRAHRSISSRVTVSQAAHLLTTLGTPEYLGTLERFQLSLLKFAGALAPGLARSKMLERIHAETSAYILPAESAALSRYLIRRKTEGAQVNINHLGEEVLGETEAERRVAGYIELLRRDEVEAISVKISSIASQLDPLAFNASLRTLRSRLSPIYEVALDAQSRGRNKLVTLDMEAYRDLELTLRLFRGLLDEPRFKNLSAGCVLQAYLPDSYELQRELVSWARQRVENGGAAIRLRLVKGANLAVERLESNHRGWELPIYGSKLEVDANYKRMLLFGVEKENARAMHLGIGSHNLFDTCFGLLARANADSEAHVSFELLEGMADHLRRALQHLGAKVLLYAPIVEEAEFPSAIAYLVRRLDENTAPENYLRHSFHMRLGDNEWGEQRERFLEASKHIPSVATEPRRKPTLGRAIAGVEPLPARLAAPFRNEPDTDFIAANNRAALEYALGVLNIDGSVLVRSQVPGLVGSFEVVAGFDPSLPGQVPYRVELLSKAGVHRAIANGHAAEEAFAGTTVNERAELLLSCADKLREHRAELLALMISDGGKRADEADTEISEAIDFAEYYARSAIEVASHDDVAFTPRGLSVVTPPWNFPLAIPVGGTLAALVMGNPVILKPALETPRVARRAAELFWEAGVPREVLQFVVCDDDAASQLISDPRVQAVVLTGATSTAQLFQRLRPDVSLFAETGGKNGLIITPMADRELAVQDIVSSAFGHAGQKCSALSQLVLHREVYDDTSFLTLLKDAVASLGVGSAWDPKNRVTPLIHEPSAVQLRALTQLEEGESWLLEPQVDPENPRLWSPGIKLGVKPGSFAHQTEFFCPVLSVLRADDLDDAIEIVNGTPFGLTSGIHTLDEREQQRWASRVRAGNLYINRKITGAIVQRQAFGGWKASSFGNGAKAGGPNYTAQFVHQRQCAPARWTRHVLPPKLDLRVRDLQARLLRSFKGSQRWAKRARKLFECYQRDFEQRFCEPRDESQLLGQDNLLRYTTVRLLLWLRKEQSTTTAGGPSSLRGSSETLPDETVEQILRVIIGSWVTNSNLTLVLEPELAPHPVLSVVARMHAAHTHSAARLDELPQSVLKDLERIIVVGPRDNELQEQANARGIFVDTRPALANGRFELLRHLREQSLSVTYHRYGHLGIREVEEHSHQAA